MSHMIHNFGVVEYPNFDVEVSFFPANSIWTLYPENVKWNICSTDGYWHCLDVSEVTAQGRIGTDLGSNFTLNDWSDVSGPGVEFVLESRGGDHIRQLNIKNFTQTPSNGEIITVESSYTLPANKYALVINNSEFEFTEDGSVKHAHHLTLINARPSDTLLIGDGKILSFNLS